MASRGSGRSSHTVNIRDVYKFDKMTCCREYKMGRRDEEGGTILDQETCIRIQVAICRHSKRYVRIVTWSYLNPGQVHRKSAWQL